MEIVEENKIIKKECLHSSVNAVLLWRAEVFYLSGSRLAMEKLDLHSLETALTLASQFLGKTYNPWQTNKCPSTRDLPNVEKHQVQLLFTSTAPDFTHQFQESNC